MGFKKLSDFYTIRATAVPDTTGGGGETSSISTVAIDTGLDSLRREVLGIYAIQMSSTTSDDAGLLECALEGLRAEIDGGADHAGVRFGTRAVLYKNVNSIGFQPEGVGNEDVLALDASEYEGFAWNTQIGAVGDSIGMLVTEDNLRYPQQYDAIVADQPIGYVTASAMNFCAVNFIDGIAPAQTYGGVTWGIRVMCRRLEADASLYAAILTGNA